jgi:hypothetical protein
MPPDGVAPLIAQERLDFLLGARRPLLHWQDRRPRSAEQFRRVAGGDDLRSNKDTSGE